MDYKKREVVKIKISWFWKDNAKYLKNTVCKPYLEMLCLRLILFYQKVKFGANFAILKCKYLQFANLQKFKILSAQRLNVYGLQNYLVFNWFNNLLFSLSS